MVSPSFTINTFSLPFSMTTHKKTFIRKGFLSVFLSSLYFLLRDKEDNEPTIEPVSTKHRLLPIDQHNYRELLQGDYLFIINFAPKPSHFKTYTKFNRFTDVAYIHVNSLFTSQIASIFAPEKLTSVFFIANSHYCLEKKKWCRIMFDQRLNGTLVFNYWFYVVVKIMRKMVGEYMYEYLYECGVMVVYSLGNDIVGSLFKQLCA